MKCSRGRASDPAPASSLGRFQIGTLFATDAAMAKARKKTPAAESAPESNGGGAAVATAPQSVGDTTAAAVDRDRIARRAYELYLQRGGSDGSAMNDWLEAERELGQPPGDKREP